MKPVRSQIGCISFDDLDKMMFFLKYFYLENFPFVINEQLWWNILKIYEYTAVIKLLPNSFDI